MKELLSRKFIACTAGLILGWAGFFSIVKKADTIMLTAMLGYTLFLVAAYIGGNVWSDFVKSKWFVKDLADK